ncbi:MAG: DUF3987 domain-containing protein, partial [Thermomicrobiales bacterium]
YLTEFSRLLNNVERESTRSIAPTLIDAWDTPGTLSNSSKPNPKIAVDPVVSIVGTVQPDVLSEIVTNAHSASGFLNRWLIVAGRRHELRPSPPTLDERAAWKLFRRVRVSIAEYGTGQRLFFTPAAESIWDEWYIATESVEENDREDAMSVRLGSLLKKIALIHAITDGARAVDVPHVNAAIALLAWSWGHTRALIPMWGESQEGRLQRQVIETLGRKGPMKRRLIQPYIGNKLGPGVFARTIKAMVDNGEIVASADGILSLVTDAMDP